MSKRLLLLLALFSPSKAWAQVPANVILNVFQIRTPAGYGSAFTMQVDHREYLITAKHMVKNLKADGSVESIELRILKGTNLPDSESTLDWKQISVRVFPCREPIDIAVLVPSESIRMTPALEPSPENMRLGQEGYFLGFPLGFALTTSGVNFPFPTPFAKKGAFSNIDTSTKGDLMLFDGYNNRGFSGGPIVFEDHRDNRPNVPRFHVVAVVAGFIPELIPTANWRKTKPNEDLSKVEMWRIKKENGSTYVLEDRESVVPTNTGIITGYSIHHAVDVIKEHPVGPPIKEQVH